MALHTSLTMLITRRKMISEIEQLADAEWRKISHAYEGYSSEDFLVMYELFIKAFVMGCRHGNTL
jgi:hypothetical protein